MFYKIILVSCAIVFCGARSLDGREGDSCVLQNGAAGVCRFLPKCQSAVQAIKQKKKPEICGFSGTRPIVCCASGQAPKPELISKYGQCQPIPENTATKTGQKAFDKCIEYQEQYVYPCEKSVTLTGKPSRGNHCYHNVDELILGGEPAHENEFPHMAMLRFGDDRDDTQERLCGGAIISEKFILTAGHCTSTSKQAVTHVFVGALKQSEAERTGKRYNVKRIIKHPQYKSPSKYNDIALLETEPMQLSQYLVPACLDVGYPLDDSKVLATGWGQTAINSVTSDILRRVIINKFEEKECVDLYATHRHFNEGIKYEQQSCYGDRQLEKDTCKGDSGGPIQIKSKSIHCMYTLVGVTSFGKDCGTPGVPAIYSRVSYYLPWIESVVWP